MKCSPAAVAPVIAAATCAVGPARFAPVRVAAFSVASLLLGLTGCDQDAANRGEAARLLNQAVAAMQEADTAKPNEEQALSDVRLGLLTAAVAPLEEAAAKGSPEQQAQARMLLARIDAQEAEALARAAAAGAAQTRLAVASLLAQLDTIDALGSTVLTAQRDPAAAIAQMDEAMAGAQAQRDRSAARQGELRETITALESEIDALTAAARTAFAQKAELENAAFVQEGPAKYETLSRATAAQRRADAADVEAQQRGIARDRAADELVQVERELTLAEESIDRFADTRDAFGQAGQDAQRMVQTLRTRQAELAETFTADLEARVNAFDEAVTGPITSAAQKAQSAAEQVGRAGSGVQGAQRQQQRAEQLDKLHLLAQTLTDATRYHADLQLSLGAISGRAAFAANPALRGKIDALAAELAGVADAFREQAGEALATAKEQLESFEPEDESAAGVRSAIARLSSELEAG